jgi:tRNA modification GTPase
MLSPDTIVAVATPPGRGGIGVVRLSGARALAIVEALIDFAKLPLEPRRATLGRFTDPESGRLLDEVVVTFFPRPRSYTAEDVVEISCHGSPVILRYLVDRCLTAGARVAEPGEFTERAFLNGRIDLTQAEAIRDLIEARTLYQARVAAEQLAGSVSQRLQPHKRALLDLVARLEAGIDFAEDDVPVLEWGDIRTALDAILADLGRLLASYQYGRMIREGLTLAIVGRPNVGKSSLFNRLLNEERAIVTPLPGTTRDLITESASVGGIPLRFVDTAGIRETTDEVENIGVQKTRQAIADSDLRMLVIDASEGWQAEDKRLLEQIQPLGRLLIAGNKCDLLPPPPPSGTTGAPDGLPMVWTSALTGQGIDELAKTILEVAAPGGCGSEGELITNFRHQQLIKKTLAALERARRAALGHVHHEMLLLDLYDALHALDEMTGATTVEDVLGAIFSTFCVGK